jgi:aminoglycoside 3-N-acetyltransferase
MTAYDDLKQKWMDSGVEPGDTLLVHSNIKRTLSEARRSGVAVKPDDILSSFLDAVGPKGTLLLPLFNFDFANGKAFDIRSTPSQMGALTEVGRLRQEAVRTGHPIYSFAAIGFRSKEFEGVDNQSGYAEDSPFGILKRLDGKIASLDLDDQDSMTFYHHVEEMKKVSYRYFKSFNGSYTDAAGIATEKTYTLFVRDVENGVRTDVNTAGALMWQQGFYKGSMPKVGSGLRTIKAQDMFRFVAELIDSSRALGTLYSIEKT